MNKVKTDIRSRVSGMQRDGRPTVFIHGVGSDSSTWNGLTERLAHIGPLISYDLRGHGGSVAPPTPWALDDFVADHIELLDQLGLPSTNVVGFSLGGLIAQAVAARHTGRVDKLVIMSAVAGRTAEERAAAQQRLEEVERDGPKAMADRGGARWHTESFMREHPEVVAEHLERLARNDPVAYAAAYRVLATNDLANELSEIKSQTLVITGDGDVGSPPHMAETMHRLIPESELRIIPNVKHAILDECVEEVAELLGSFLSDSPSYLTGNALAVRRSVLGDTYVDRALSPDDSISEEFQRFITQYCWGEVWTDPRLQRKERSLVTLAMTGALGRMSEFQSHVRGAVRNGVTPEELTALLKQLTVYCGVPAGVAAAREIRGVLEAQDKALKPPRAVGDPAEEVAVEQEYELDVSGGQ